MECAAVSQTTLPWLKKLVREHLYASLTNEALVIQGVSVEEIHHLRLLFFPHKVLFISSSFNDDNSSFNFSF